MNAHALLSRQGWRGHGHSLHKNDDSIGLAKPLLLNRKDNTKGLGVAQHFNNDQWWLNAFDEQLKGLESNGKHGVKQTVTTGKLNIIENGSLGKWSVYSSFVRGGFLEGTVDLLTTPELTSDSSSDSKDSSSESKDKKSSKKGDKETKEERRARKEAKKQRKEARALRRAARRERREARAKGKKSSGSDDSLSEEKRQRRERKEEKRRKRSKE